MGNIIYPHRIRLRGPWECEPLERLPAGGDLPPPRRMRLPARWREAGLPDFSGRVRFQRSFGYPGQIDSWERVWLTFAGMEGQAAITLNNHFLGRAQGPYEFEVTGLLGSRNNLEVVVDSSSANAGLWGEVALEVRCTAFLQNVRAWREGERIHVAGAVIGTADQPLEVYILWGRHTVAYQPVKPGESFTAISEDLPPPSSSPDPLRVELVNLSTVWHALDLPVP